MTSDTLTSKIIRFFFILTLSINIILFPIGVLLGSPEKINSVFDRVELEEKIIDIYINSISLEIKESAEDDTTEAELQEDIRRRLISEGSLRKTRIRIVEEVHKSIENSEVPEIIIDLENPLSKIKTKVDESVESLTFSFRNITFCSGEENCTSIGDIIDNITGNETSEEEDTDSESDPFQPRSRMRINRGPVVRIL